jgi:hypothetical protein
VRQNPLDNDVDKKTNKKLFTWHATQRSFEVEENGLLMLLLRTSQTSWTTLKNHLLSRWFLNRLLRTTIWDYYITREHVDDMKSSSSTDMISG